MKDKTHKRIGIGLVLSALAAGSSFGSIVYVDADTANSTLETSGALSLGVNYTASTGAGLGTDDLWHERTLASVNGGSAWTAQAGGAETPERLVTQITLPEAGTYNIFGYQWINSAGTGGWDCGFQLGSGSNVAYDKNNTTDIAGTSGHFTTAVLVGSGDHLMEASLGTWNTATDGLTVTVYADGGFVTAGSDNRTWYDGVGYEAIPEPATLGLIALSAFGVVVSRRIFML